MKSGNALNVKLNPSAETEEEFMAQITKKLQSLGVVEGQPLTFAQAVEVTAEVFNISEEAARLMIMVDMAKGILPFNVEQEPTSKTVN